MLPAKSALAFKPVPKAIGGPLASPAAKDYGSSHNSKLCDPHVTEPPGEMNPLRFGH